MILRGITMLITIIVLMSSNYDQKQPELLKQPEKIRKMEKLEKEKIEDLLIEYKTSLNTSNAKLAQSLYAKDGIFMPSGAPSAKGGDEILKSYETIFSQIQLNIEFFIDEIYKEGEFAFATTSSKGKTTILANGEVIPEENRELFVFEKTDEEWKIARYMFNKTS